MRQQMTPVRELTGAPAQNRCDAHGSPDGRPPPAGCRLYRFWRNLDPMVPMLLVAALVGVASSIAVEGFRQAMYAIMRFYTAHEHLVAAAKELPPLALVAIPILGATLGGLVMWAGQRWIKRPRGPEYMEAVLVGNGELPLAPNLIRTTASLMAVSTGITIGREGTMIQFAAVMSSLLGRIGRPDVAHRRLIVACGAAAGFAGAYHAPIAGTLFVSEIILGGLALREIAAILVAAVMGELTTQSLFATGPLYLSHTIPLVSFADLLDAALLGVLAGVLGPAFLWLLDNTRRGYQALVGFPPVRMGLMGLVIGLLSLLRPEVWGNGYSVVQSFLVDHWALSSVAAVLGLRLLTTTAASAAGIPGGVLTPTLALGGALGLLVQQTMLLGDASHSQALWVLVGMGSLLAATTHAPAMSAIMVFEITRNYDVVLAAMPACVIGSVLGSLLRERSVYAEALGLSSEAGTRRDSLLDTVTGLQPPQSAPSPSAPRDTDAAEPIAQERDGMPGAVVHEPSAGAQPDVPGAPVPSPRDLPRSQQ